MGLWVKKESGIMHFVLFFIFCIYLSVKIYELLLMRGQNVTHTHTLPKRGYSRALGTMASLQQTEMWILFQA